MIVAFYFTHNEGTVKGVLDQPGQEALATDLYECDGEIATFDTRDEADAWIKQRDAANVGD